MEGKRSNKLFSKEEGYWQHIAYWRRSLLRRFSIVHIILMAHVLGCRKTIVVKLGVVHSMCCQAIHSVWCLSDSVILDTTTRWHQNKTV